MDCKLRQSEMVLLENESEFLCIIQYYYMLDKQMMNMEKENKQITSYTKRRQSKRNSKRQFFLWLLSLERVTDFYDEFHFVTTSTAAA